MEYSNAKRPAMPPPESASPSVQFVEMIRSLFHSIRHCQACGGQTEHVGRFFCGRRFIYWVCVPCRKDTIEDVQNH